MPLINIGRRRSVLTEKVIRKKYEVYSYNENVTLDFSHLFRKDKFHVELERADGTMIDPNRICGFKVDSDKDTKILKIKSTLEINEWIPDYEKVTIARIFLYNSNGDDINSMDFDVIFRGYSLGCDYNSDESMKPVFLYDIIG